MQRLNKIPTIALAVLLAISVLISIMFFCGGDVDPNAEYLEPNFTGALLNWGYILIGVAAIATIIVAIVGFIIKIQADTRSAITSLVGIGVVALLLIITYSAADTTPFSNISEDTDQSEFSLKITNMCIVSSFILAAIATFVSLFGFLVKRF